MNSTTKRKAAVPAFASKFSADWRPDTTPHSSNEAVFTAGFLFAGIGAGALGFIQAAAKLGNSTARFVSVGGIDIDPLACADFELLTGSRATQADVSIMTPEQLRAAWGAKAPNVVFHSSPCVGLSGLLPKAKAETAHYQFLNSLTLVGMELLCSTWRTPPDMLVMENVPRIQTRGAKLLHQIKDLLTRHGYRFHDGTHDCGEIGNLAQHRRRYLLVARRPSKVASFIHRAPKLRVRGCGEVLGTLPLPDDPAAGAMHESPKLSMLNLVRLALIPAGGDWRDLPRNLDTKAYPGRRLNTHNVLDWTDPAKTIASGSRPSAGALAVAEKRMADVLGPKDGQTWFNGAHGVMPWGEPANTVTGSRCNGAINVSDPRLADAVGMGSDNEGRHTNKYAVTDWNEPAKTVTGTDTRVGSGAPSVADPRIELPDRDGRFTNNFKVRGFDQPVGVITGDTDIQTGAQSVADPRLVDAVALGKVAEGASSFAGRPGLMGVADWQEPVPAVTGSASVTSGNSTAAVADPRPLPPELCSPLVEGQEKREGWAKYDVRRWEEPARTVTGSGTNGGCGVADPREVPLRCSPRAGAYRVLTWQEAAAAATITGSLRVDNGPAAVADPRKPPSQPTIIIAADGTWHRPLTTLELAALQGLPAKVDGKPLVLAGKSQGMWRKHIGNAVPVGAAQAIAGSMLKALLASKLGGWFFLDSEGVWVQRRTGRREQHAQFQPALAWEVARG